MFKRIEPGKSPCCRSKSAPHQTNMTLFALTFSSMPLDKPAIAWLASLLCTMTNMTNMTILSSYIILNILSNVLYQGNSAMLTVTQAGAWRLLKITSTPRTGSFYQLDQLHLSVIDFQTKSSFSTKMTSQ